MKLKLVCAAALAVGALVAVVSLRTTTVVVDAPTLQGEVKKAELGTESNPTLSGGF